MLSLVSKIAIFLVLLSRFPGSDGGELKDSSPNVILIIADQMRGDAMSILGHPNAKTPNLDRMAKEGVIFTNYFTNNPVCVPSRMSMFSGMYPHEHGALSNQGPEKRFSSAENTLLGYFHEKGYRLGWFGKDNHTYDRPVLDSLLDNNTSRRREAFRAYSAHTAPHWASTAPWPKKELFAYKTTSDALEFISQESALPFFTVLSLFDPHPPYFAPADYVANYPINEIKLPEQRDPSDLSERLALHKRALLYDKVSEAELKHTMAHYYAAIEWGVDYQVGRILDALTALNLEENTIVLFTSEHGDFMGEYGMVRKGMFLYDALLRVPFIWYGPGRIGPGIQSDMLAQSVDILPTMIDLTEGESPQHSGFSLIDVLEGKQSTPVGERTIFASAGYSPLSPSYFDAPATPYYSPSPDETRAFHSRVFDLQTEPSKRTMMVRTADWKLIVSETQSPELYQMGTTGNEQVNLASDPQFADVLKEMQELAVDEWNWSE